MAERKALVQIAGQIQELPTGDTLQGAGSGGGGGGSAPVVREIMHTITASSLNRHIIDLSGYDDITVTLSNVAFTGTLDFFLSADGGTTAQPHVWTTSGQSDTSGTGTVHYGAGSSPISTVSRFMDVSITSPSQFYVSRHDSTNVNYHYHGMTTGAEVSNSLVIEAASITSGMIYVTGVKATIPTGGGIDVIGGLVIEGYTTPAYDNALSVGDRRNLMVVGYNSGSTGNITALINGAVENGWYFDSGITAGAFIFTFFNPVMIEELRWKQDNTTAHGTWAIEGYGSNGWVEVGVAQTLGGATTSVLTANTQGKGYTIYRLAQKSGVTSNSPYIHEIEFKIGSVIYGTTQDGLAPSGGTTGQALLKTSDNDHEYTWSDLDLTNWGATTELTYPTTVVGNSGAAHFMRGNVFTALQDIQITSMDFKSIGVYDYEMFVAITTEGADPTSSGAEIVEYRGVGGTLTSVADQNIVQRITMSKPAIIRAGERFTIGTIRRTGTSSGMMVASNAASDPYGNDDLLYTRRTLQFSSDALGSNPVDSSWNGTYYWMQIQYLPVAPVTQTLKIGQISGDTTLTAEHFNGVTHWEVTGTAILTVPNLSPKYSATFEAIDANEVSFVAGTGATVNSFADQLKLAGQYAAGTLVPKGNGVYTLIGNTKA